MKTTVAAFIASACLVLWQAGCAPANQRATENAAVTPDPSPSPAASPEAAGADGQLPPMPGDDDPQALVEWGTAAYKKNHDAEAAEAFQKAVSRDPNHAEAHYKLGLAYHALGKDEDAEKSFERAAKAYEKLTDKEPKNAAAHFYLGLCYAKLGKYEEAVKAHKQAVKLDAEDDEKFYELGVAHSKLAQYKEAIAAFEKALDINPDNFRAGDAIEKAKPGLARREAFLKQQEKQREEELKRGRGGRKPDNANANANANTGTGPAVNAPAPAAPRPTPQSP